MSCPACAYDPATTNLLGAFIGFSLWGFLVCLFVVTMWNLRAKKTKHNPAITGIIIIFVMNLAETVASIIRVYTGFIVNADDPGVWFAYKGSPQRGPLDISEDIFYLISTVIADCILCWRLFIIWSRDRRVLILPLMILPLTIIGTAFILKFDILFAYGSPTDNDVDVLNRWTAAMFIGDVILNGLVTALIIGKLFWVGHRTKALSERGTNRYTRIILVLVESGSFLTAWMMVFAVLVLTNYGPIANAFSYSNTRVVGIVPTLIMLQLSLGYTQPGDTMGRGNPADAKGNADIKRPAEIRERPGPSARVQRKRPRDSLSLDVSSIHNSDVALPRDPERPEVVVASGKSGFDADRADLEKQLRDAREVEIQREDDLRPDAVKP